MKLYTVPVVHPSTIRWGEFTLTDEDINSITSLLREEIGTVPWSTDEIKTMAYDLVRIARVIVNANEPPEQIVAASSLETIPV